MTMEDYSESYMERKKLSWPLADPDSLTHMLPCKLSHLGPSNSSQASRQLQQLKRLQKRPAEELIDKSRLDYRIGNKSK